MITHLACIMDGNRRWAKARGLMPWYGHSQGAESVRTVIEFCKKKQIPYLSLYAFSIENFNRSATEQNYIFSFMVDQAAKQLPDFLANDIQIRFVGDRSLFPVHVKGVCEDLENKTDHCKSLLLQVFFCYGARQELVAATKKIAHDIERGVVSAAMVNEETLTNALWTGSVPSPDLIIRTGGHRRLSNFMLFQAAYSELYFLDCLWPDISMQDLDQAAASFYGQQRNFGT